MEKNQEGKNMTKTVYILGSGASKASSFELPCMKGFFTNEDLTKRDYPKLIEFVHRRFPRTDLGELNLEDVATCLELSLDRVGSFGHSPDGGILDARQELDRYVSKRLAITQGDSSSLHELLLGKDITAEGCRDTIITVNYDLVVDQTLYKLSPKQSDQGPLVPECLLARMYHLLQQRLLYGGFRASLPRRAMQLGFYLKLHGSLDWLYCANPGCLNHQQFFANWMGNRAGHNVAGDPCEMCGAPLVSVLAPPTMMKTFSQFPKLGFLWSLAHRELNAADRIVIFGLSFAASDYYLQWLFRSAITDRANAPQIFNINTDGGTSAKIRRATGVEPVECATVDQYRLQVDGLTRGVT